MRRCSERGGPGDTEAAKALLQESIAATDVIGLGLYARLARQKLARLALGLRAYYRTQLSWKRG